VSMKHKSILISLHHYLPLLRYIHYDESRLRKVAGKL
jgi:hypothetical protein